MLTIALEPEAAALYVKHLPVGKRISDDFETFAPGSKYIVVDVGGMVCVLSTSNDKAPLNDKNIIERCNCNA